MPEPSGFVFVFGSLLALHREGSKMHLQVAGKGDHPITIEQAQRIRDDFDLAIRDALAARREEQTATSDGHGGETRGDG